MQISRFKEEEDYGKQRESMGRRKSERKKTLRDRERQERDGQSERNRGIMKETDNKMEAARERNNKNMTGQKNKKGDFPHQYSLLSHRCVHLGS